jgi:hypothetical protein
MSTSPSEVTTSAALRSWSSLRYELKLQILLDKLQVTDMTRKFQTSIRMVVRSTPYSSISELLRAKIVHFILGISMTVCSVQIFAQPLHRVIAAAKSHGTYFKSSLRSVCPARGLSAVSHGSSKNGRFLRIPISTQACCF